MLPSVGPIICLRTKSIFEKNITTGQIKSYVYVFVNHLARVDGVIGDPDANVYFYHTDHLGSIKAVTDMAGEVVWNADYLAFGTRFGISEGSAFEEWHGFTGKEMIRRQGCITLTLGGMIRVLVGLFRRIRLRMA